MIATNLYHIPAHGSDGRAAGLSIGRLRWLFCIAVMAVMALCDTALAVNPPLLNPKAIKAPVETEAADSSSMVAQAFALIPDAELDILTKDMRREMTIYMENDSVYRIRNIYGDLSWIEEMDDDYLRIHLTDVSTLQLKALPCSKKGINLIMTIYTVAGDSDTADSTIQFYNLLNPDSSAATLSALPPKSFFKLPEPKDFYDIKAGDAKSGSRRLSMGEILEEMPFHTVAYSISPEGYELTGRLTISNYLSQEARKRVQPYLKPDLHWIWNGKKFVIVKN